MTQLQACFHTDDKKYHFHGIETAFSHDTVINEKLIPNDTALGGHIWEGPEIYWNCDTHYKWLTDEQITNLVKAALLEASLLTPLKIKKKNRKMADAQLRLSWLTKAEDSRLISNSTLGYCWGPGKGLGGNCVMNADVLWLLRTTPLLAEEAKQLGMIENYVSPTQKIKYFDPLHTLKHELAGHGLGMRHINDINQQKTAIMYPAYNGLRLFGPGDIQYLQSLYGSIPQPTTIMQDINTRIQDLYRN